LRVTYVGELGWELYVPTELAAGVYDALVAAGADLGLRHAGYHAMDSLRIEKAYRSWGHDLGGEDTPLEAGLGFAVAWSKPGGFVGRDALLRQKATGVRRRLVHLALSDPSRMLYHNEPIWRDGVRVGRITSAMFGHTLGQPLGIGYIANAGGVVDADWVKSGRYEIEVAGDRIAAEVSLAPFYDPKSLRVKEVAAPKAERGVATV
jgi:4-methylaminobutanoate oxidase (formaldehyde-forming)